MESAQETDQSRLQGNHQKRNADQRLNVKAVVRQKPQGLNHCVLRERHNFALANDDLSFYAGLGLHGVARLFAVLFGDFFVDHHRWANASANQFRDDSDQLRRIFALQLRADVLDRRRLLSLRQRRHQCIAHFRRSRLEKRLQRGFFGCQKRVELIAGQ